MQINYSAETFEQPFRYSIIDDFIDYETVKRINEEWPINEDPRWKKENCKTSFKWGLRELPRIARSVVDAIDVREIEKITGISDLIVDPDIIGSGLHCIPSGGYLKTHVDFNQHPKGWHRRVNLLLYLNQQWRQEWLGQLALGRPPEVFINPVAGCCVIFETTEHSWHGHPEPLRCPKHIQRRSLALYFYTQEPPNEPPHSTIYAKR